MLLAGYTLPLENIAKMKGTPQPLIRQPVVAEREYCRTGRCLQGSACKARRVAPPV